MADPDSVAALPFFASIVFALAGLSWLAVGKILLSRSDGFDVDDLYNALGVASCLTGGAFIIGVVAWAQ
jgi:hypothetical protein